MIVTEQMLAPYRADGRPLSFRIADRLRLRNGTFIPSNLFSDSSAFFQPFWWAKPDKQDPKQDLQVVAVLAFTEHVPVLKPGREWIALSHQAGGYSNEHVLMIATRLESRPYLKPALNAIAREGYFAEDGRFNKNNILASRIAKYVTALDELNLDCESSWRLLTESVYPIDATQDNLDRLAVDAPALDDIADWTGFIRARFSSDPAILLLTENSD